MNPSLENLPVLARQKEAENKKFFSVLRKRKPKQLDKIAQQVHDEVFASTDCLTCANCCKTTGPLFTSKDVDRIASYLKMKPKDFENQYLRTDEDADKVLQQVPCTFLASDNYCLIYDVRPKACREYPHTDRNKLYQIGKLTVKNTSICPATYTIVEKLKEVIK